MTQAGAISTGMFIITFFNCLTTAVVNHFTVTLTICMVNLTTAG